MNEFNIDQTHLNVLTYIYHHQYISFADLSVQLTEYANLDEIVTELELKHLISFRLANSPSTDEGYEHYNIEQSSHLVTLTNGNAIVEEEAKHAKELESQLRPLLTIAEKASSLAESAAVQANIAKEQADKASKTSLVAKIRANLSIIISAISLLATLLANADKIVHNVQKILSHLSML